MEHELEFSWYACPTSGCGDSFINDFSAHAVEVVDDAVIALSLPGIKRDDRMTMSRP